MIVRDDVAARVDQEARALPFAAALRHLPARIAVEEPLEELERKLAAKLLPAAAMPGTEYSNDVGAAAPTFITAMLTTAGLTLSMTSANETPTVAGARGAAGCAIELTVRW